MMVVYNMPTTVGTRSAPLRALDRVIEHSGTEIAGVKAVQQADPYMNGHYPNFTLYPGVFLLEGITQLLDEHLAARARAHQLVQLSHVQSARFLAPMLPGDTITIRCRLDLSGESIGVRAECVNCAGVQVAKIKATYVIDDRSRKC